MNVLDPRIAEMLDDLVPPRPGPRDWNAIVATASVTGTAVEARDSPPRRAQLRDWVRERRHQRVLVSVLAGLTLVLAGAAVATAAGVRFWAGPPTPQAIDTTEATKLVEFTLTTDFSRWQAGDTIATWHMPQPDGSVCVLNALASSEPTAPGSGGNPAGGGVCSMSEWRPPPGKDVALFVSTTRDGGYSWLVSGKVNPDSGIAKVALLSATGPVSLAYASGWFLGQLPPSGSANELPQGGPYVLIGYDSRGKEVARVDLQDARSSLRH